jgi:hypothetical protein
MAMDNSKLVNRVVAGLNIERALKVFVEACRQPGTRWITERWFAPRRQHLIESLSNPITEDEPVVLRELLWQHIKFEEAFDFLSRKPLSWSAYKDWRGAETLRLERRRIMAPTACISIPILAE